MKGASSHDGKMHGNIQTIERYDESKGHKPAKPKPTGGESGGEHEASGMDEIKQVAMEHGPAHKLTIEHDHDGGEHKITSHHEDGHVHHSTHSSPAEAHAAAAHLGGASDTNELQEAHTGMQEEDTLHEAGHRSGIERSSHHTRAGEGFMPEHGID